MSLFSMTGFGKAEANILGIDVSLEIKTVNNRYFECIMKMPREIQSLELSIKKSIQKKISRGSLQVFINFRGNVVNSLPSGINTKVAKAYIEAASELEKLGASGTLTAKDLLQLENVVAYENESLDLKVFAENFSPVVDQAVEQLLQMREAEGTNMFLDLKTRIFDMQEMLTEVESILPERIGKYHTILKERVTKLIEEKNLDENRMLQEIGFIADKLDITEELVRFRSHNDIFLQSMQNAGPHGKKLNFILQEMGREANTLGTKAQFIDIQHIAVKLKEEIETIREQVLNIE